MPYLTFSYLTKDGGTLLDGFIPATPPTLFQRTPSVASDLDSVSSYYMETSRANSYSVMMIMFKLLLDLLLITFYDQAGISASVQKQLNMLLPLMLISHQRLPKEIIQAGIKNILKTNL